MRPRGRQLTWWDLRHHRASYYNGLRGLPNSGARHSWWPNNDSPGHPPFQPPLGLPSCFQGRAARNKREIKTLPSSALSTLNSKAHQISLLSCMWSRCQTGWLLSASLRGSHCSARPQGSLGTVWAEATHSWSLGWGANCLVLSWPTTSHGSLGPTASPPQSSAWSLRPPRYSSCCFSSRISHRPGRNLFRTSPPLHPREQGFPAWKSPPFSCHCLNPAHPSGPSSKAPPPASPQLTTSFFCSFCD